MPDDLLEKVRTAAEAEFQPMTVWIISALVDRINKNPPKMETVVKTKAKTGRLKPLSPAGALHMESVEYFNAHGMYPPDEWWEARGGRGS